MFKKLASDALGLSDIGVVVSPEDFDKTEADDFIMTERNEKIYFLIKTKSDEYCFTNLALIHVDGTSALSSKRTLRRYDYIDNHFSNVTLETAGTIDLDVEIKFYIGDTQLSIDIHKKFVNEIKDLYKTLCYLENVQAENLKKEQFMNNSLEVLAGNLPRTTLPDVQTALQFATLLLNNTYQWQLERKEEIYQKDFSFVYEFFIKN